MDAADAIRKALVKYGFQPHVHVDVDHFAVALHLDSISVVFSDKRVKDTIMLITDAHLEACVARERELRVDVCSPTECAQVKLIDFKWSGRTDVARAIADYTNCTFAGDTLHNRVNIIIAAVKKVISETGWSAWRIRETPSNTVTVLIQQPPSTELLTLYSFCTLHAWFVDAACQVARSAMSLHNTKPAPVVRFILYDNVLCIHAAITFSSYEWSITRSAKARFMDASQDRLLKWLKSATAGVHDYGMKNSYSCFAGVSAEAMAIVYSMHDGMCELLGLTPLEDDEEV